MDKAVEDSVGDGGTAAMERGLQVDAIAIAGKGVLLVERFDRIRANGEWTRKAMVSALTLFGLDETMARYASYEDLAEIIRRRFTSPKATLRELHGRLAFNILCGTPATTRGSGTASA